MALKEEAATKKKLIGIRCCTHSHKSMESSIKTLAPLCETTDLCKLVRFIRYFLEKFVLLMQRMKWCGGDGLLLKKGYKAAAFDRIVYVSRGVRVGGTRISANQSCSICSLFGNTSYWLCGNSFRQIRICSQVAPVFPPIKVVVFVLCLGIQAIGSVEIPSDKSGFLQNKNYWFLENPSEQIRDCICVTWCESSVPPLCISCYPATNPDLSEGISTEPIACIPKQRTNTTTLIGGNTGRIQTQCLQYSPVPPPCTSCYPATNPDLSEGISTEPIACIPKQRTNTTTLIGGNTVHIQIEYLQHSHAPPLCILRYTATNISTTIGFPKILYNNLTLVARKKVWQRDNTIHRANRYVPFVWE
ncbi:hypothetical protein HZH68_014444 [Vespula germanica]|uniref:Uncharacterized protein n=1 Tax=Vespula germanica TaxID=30212 RepID=A0A834MSH2_VESGE|nr:hypothetical protein HZH68_014444 [Vespula germanica]